LGTTRKEKKSRSAGPSTKEKHEKKKPKNVHPLKWRGKRKKEVGKREDGFSSNPERIDFILPLGGKEGRRKAFPFYRERRNKKKKKRQPISYITGGKRASKKRGKGGGNKGGQGAAFSGKKKRRGRKGKGNKSKKKIRGKYHF